MLYHRQSYLIWPSIYPFLFPLLFLLSFPSLSSQRIQHLLLYKTDNLSVKQILFYIDNIIFLCILKLVNKIIPFDLSAGSIVSGATIVVPMLLNSSNDIVAFFDFLPDFLFCSCSFSFFATLTNCSSYASFDSRMAWCNSCSNVSSTALRQL